MHWQGFVLAAVVPALIYIATMWLPRFFPADKLLLSIANFLCALGVLVLYSTDLIKGTNYGMQQAVYYGAGIVAMLFVHFTGALYPVLARVHLYHRRVRPRR